MNITLFVGNGFDIQAGLKTKYSDFYDYLKRQAKSNLSLMDNVIFNEINNPYKIANWADFEMGIMDLCSSGINSEVTPELIANAKEELEGYLGKYLSEIENNISYTDKNIDKNIFLKSFQGMLMLLPRQRILELSSILPLNNSSVQMNIVDFNYTSLFRRAFINLSVKNFTTLRILTINGEKALDLNRGKYIKIHGEISQDMILGGSNIDQLGEKMNDSQFRFYFIKPELDDIIGKGLYPETMGLIDNTSLFCILGMSLGESDKFLWSKIINKLLKNKNSAAIIYAYEEDARVMTFPLRRKLITEEIKKKFLNHYTELNKEEYESLSGRILVLFNTNLFNIYNAVNKLKKAQEVK